eukprot:m.67535 g.67535  ORF g.67535 m.67535 type:complete len:585 (-) comp7684_c0_seq5:117-1871(-)
MLETRVAHPPATAMPSTENPVPEEHLAVNVSSHNLEAIEVACKGSTAPEAAPAEADRDQITMTLVDVGGRRNTPLHMERSVLEKFFVAIAEYIPCLADVAVGHSALVQTFPLKRKAEDTPPRSDDPFGTPSPTSIQAPHPLALCDPPCDRCSFLGARPRPGMVSRFMSFMGFGHENIEAEYLEYRRNRRRRCARRCLVAWRTYCHKKRCLRAEMRHMLAVVERMSCPASPIKPLRSTSALRESPEVPLPDVETAGLASVDKSLLRRLSASNGSIVDMDMFCMAILQFGCEDSVRPTVWKLLLGHYHYTMSSELCEEVDIEVQREFQGIMQECDRVTDEEELSRGIQGDHLFSHQCSSIWEDVNRCDHTLEFYQNEANQKALCDILRAYVLQQRYPGYIQGMSDIAEEIFYVVKDEAVAFSCFRKLMMRNAIRFDKSAELGIQKCIASLRSLLRFQDSELLDHLQAIDTDHLLFCYSWFLLDFKRQFVGESIFRVWEAIWAARLVCTKNLAIFIAYVLLQRKREELLACSSFPEVIVLFNRDEPADDGEAVVQEAVALAESIRNQLGHDEARHQSFDAGTLPFPV